MRTLAWSASMFAASGLIGPLLRLATWPPGPAGQPLGDFIYDLVLLLWPTQPVAAMEASIGLAAAISLAVGLNVLAFVIAGVVAGIVARRWPLLVVLYVIVGGLVSFVALWIADFSSAHVRLGPLFVALLAYIVPFFAVWRLASKQEALNPPPAR